MKRLLIMLLMLAPVAALAVTPAPSPSQTPNTNDMAVSGNLGFAAPFDGPFDSFDPVLTGTFEYYSSPRISWRGLMGFTRFTSNFPGDPKVETLFFNANFVYNWERGKIHPFATAGIGVYNKNASSGLPSDLDETVFGVNAGGGIDWFIGPRWGLKFEGTFHGLTGNDPNTILVGTAGVMFWF